LDRFVRATTFPRTLKKWSGMRAAAREPYQLYASSFASVNWKANKI
jgi:hypothetical protein